MNRRSPDDRPYVCYWFALSLFALAGAEPAGQRELAASTRPTTDSTPSSATRCSCSWSSIRSGDPGDVAPPPRAHDPPAAGEGLLGAAQICVDHMQPSKAQHIAALGEPAT